MRYARAAVGDEGSGATPGGVHDPDLRRRREPAATGVARGTGGRWWRVGVGDARAVGGPDRVARPPSSGRARQAPAPGPGAAHGEDVVLATEGEVVGREARRGPAPARPSRHVAAQRAAGGPPGRAPPASRPPPGGGRLRRREPPGYGARSGARSVCQCLVLTVPVRKVRVSLPPTSRRSPSCSGAGSPVCSSRPWTYVPVDDVPGLHDPPPVLLKVDPGVLPGHRVSPARRPGSRPGRERSRRAAAAQHERRPVDGEDRPGTAQSSARRAPAAAGASPRSPLAPLPAHREPGAAGASAGPATLGGPAVSEDEEHPHRAEGDRVADGDRGTR